MKKLMSLVALAIVGSVVAASAEEVLSANAVGYVKRSVPAGGFQIVSIPFDNIASEDGTYKFGDTQIANDLPNGSAVMFWNAESQVWAGGNKNAKGWPAAQANRVLAVGEAFFVKNTSGEALEVTAAGEVPSEPASARSIAGGNNFTIAADPYPVDVKFGDTELAKDLPVGAGVMFWNADSQVWAGGNKNAKGWPAAQSNRVVSAGEGFFIKSASASAWEAAKPYSWP